MNCLCCATSIQPSVTVPAGWGIGTSLTPVDASYDPNAKKGGTVDFKPTTVDARTHDAKVVVAVTARMAVPRRSYGQ